ncbi:DUF362 domain-containing protein [Candidatus Poribacteria bacterium]|nr:DUF362 domain-containing protein [Candidatus Poribacteria bacterium]
MPPGARVLLKPNFVRAMAPESGGVTHPAFIAAVAELVREAGAGEILVGDSPAFGSAAGAAARIGLRELLVPSGARIIEFQAVRRVHEGLQGGVFRALSLSGEALDADVLINLPKAKAHCQMVLTGAVKNLFGCIPGRRKALMHCLVKNDRYLFGRMLVDNARSLGAELHLLDGVVAMEGQGPANGTPRPWGWILAAADPFALDRVMAAALGYQLDEVPVLCAARDMAAGCTDLDRIALHGATLEELQPAQWRRAELLPISFNPFRLAVGYVKHKLQWRRGALAG